MEIVTVRRAAALGERIVSADERQVTFLAREGTTPGGDERQVPVTLTALEFTRRWALHVLPAGITKSRQFGGWSTRRREAYVDQCVRLLEAAAVPYSAGATEFEPSAWPASEESSRCCPSCGGELRLLSQQDKPSWRDLFASSVRPSWYGLTSSLRCCPDSG